jgi:hypothetical protein
MAFIPAGQVTLGAEQGVQTGALSRVRNVRLRPFYIARRELSEQAIRQFLRARNHALTDDAALTLELAQELVATMGMDLPTEDEWETAAAWDPVRSELMRYPKGVGFDRRGRLVQVSDVRGNCLNALGGRWEFVRDRYQDQAILKGCSARVAQLCWLTDATICQTAYRLTVSAGAQSADYGVRPVVRVPESVLALDRLPALQGDER